MSKVKWKPGTFIYPIPAVMVSCGNMTDSNIVTVAWTGILNTDPATVYISLRQSRYSYELIKKNKQFVINLTTRDLAFATDWCGVKSGRDFDKFKEMKLIKQKAFLVECPLIEQSPVNIECEVLSFNNLGTHDMIIAKVLSIDVDQKYIDKNGAFDISKCNLIAYANGGYFELGKKIRTFGYSVRKNKKTKKKKK